MKYVLFVPFFLILFKVNAQYNATTSDPSKNWTVVKSFNPDGSVKTITKTYFDNRGNLIQVQDKDMQSGQVLAKEPLYDNVGRQAGTSLAAPINNSNFGYKSNFILNSSGSRYTFLNFDGPKTNNPDPIGSKNISGTLGWYYSDYNTSDLRISATDYPYARTEFYKDGSGKVKRGTGIGNAYRMGQGRESMNFTTPVINELDNYFLVRNKFFTTTELGAMPSKLENGAIQNSMKDATGTEVISISDKHGRVLMSGIPGNDFIVSNSVELTAFRYKTEIKGYNKQISGGTLPVSAGLIMPENSATANIRVSFNGTIIYTGVRAGYTISNIVGPTDKLIIESDEPLLVIYTMTDLYANYPGFPQLPATYVLSTKLALSDMGSSENFYFKLFTPTTVNFTSTPANNTQFKLYDMGVMSEDEGSGITAPANGSLSLNPGYYKISMIKGALALSYNVGLAEMSYSFYDQIGRLVATIAPEGVKRLIQNINAYSTKNDIPFFTSLQYDNKGRLLSRTRVDAGKTEFIFRKDGKLRFIQDAAQQTTGSFTYINYDKWERVIEKGEYRPSGDVTFAGLKTNSSILENTTANGGLSITANKYEWVRTKYDLEDNTHSQSGYVQKFLRNEISMSEGPDSKTWYSYDNEGRVSWVIRWVNGLGYKTTDYKYDIEGKVLSLVFQKNVPAETFVHYYEYDANGGIEKVSTNTVDNFSTKTLQAKYAYYLNGLAKRTEIGGNLQGIDYTYALDGKLKAINHSDKTKDPGNDAPGTNGFLTDAFGELLEYYQDDFVRTGDPNLPNDLTISFRETGRPEYKAAGSITFEPGFESEDNAAFSTVIDGSTSFARVGIATSEAPEQFGGRIRGMSWFSKKPPGATGVNDNPNMYVYKYDKSYQFQDATWGTISGSNTFLPQAGVNKETISSYDYHGNILNLSRTDGSGSLVDNFAYNYVVSPKPTNKLSGITQQTTNQSYATYQYDQTGRLTAEIPGPAYGGQPGKYIKYNSEGKVIAVYSNSAMTASYLIVSFVYDESGNRIKKMSYNAGVLQTTTYYVYGAGPNLMSIYTQQNSGPIAQTEVPIDGLTRVGVYMRQSNSYRYEMMDHLGNVRAVFVKNTVGTTDMVLFRDYYPFGKEIPGRSYTDAAGYRYAYQGQYAENDPETGWSAFQLRMYDTRTAKWLSVDPKGQFLSPYAGMGNDPVNGVDPDGGFFEELRNLFLHGRFASNAAMARMKELDEMGIQYKYGWSGDKAEGVGVISYITTFANEDDPTYHYAVIAQKFKAVRDDVVGFYWGNTFISSYSIVPYIEFIQTLGARITAEAKGAAGFDINLLSVVLSKVDMLAPAETVGGLANNKVELTQGFGIGLGFTVDVGASYKLSGESPSAEFNLDIGAADFFASMEILGGGNAGENGLKALSVGYGLKGAFLYGVEFKTYMKVKKSNLEPYRNIDIRKLLIDVLPQVRR